MIDANIQEGLTFDDVLLIPARSEVLPGEVDTRTKLSRNITLNIPIDRAAMDTVTESHLAIALAQQGGIGFVHRNIDHEERTPRSCWAAGCGAPKIAAMTMRHIRQPDN